MARSLNEIIRSVTEIYLQNITPSSHPSPEVIETELVEKVSTEIKLENALRDKGDKLHIPQKLCASQIADIMMKTCCIRRICCGGVSADPEYDLLSIYMTEGEDEGIYVTSEDVFKRIAKQYNYSITSREMKDVLELVALSAPRVMRTNDRDLIAVNNGIFNYVTKTLEPFSEDYVFMAKSRVNYNVNATNVQITEPDGDIWDIESWMDDLSDDPEVVDILWKVLGAIIRPFVRWNKSAWFYSNTGNNGKGTLCELMRQLCGEGSYASVPLVDFAKDFALEPLTRSTAIIVDENDVGLYIDKAANLKAVITNDVIAINRKFKTPISYQFYGFMVQCLNEFPRIKDKSDSFYRRQLFIPFDRCFTGREKKYIKEDYLHRQEVLEYVLYKVLNMPDYYELTAPESCVVALTEYKDFNDPVRQYMEEIMEQLQWDLVPFSFLYELYKAWFKKNMPSGGIQGRNTFITDFLNILPEYPEWYCLGRSKAIRTGSRMVKPEPLIYEYNLTEFRNARYTGNDPERISTLSDVKATYNGILRQSSGLDVGDGDGSDDLSESES